MKDSVSAGGHIFLGRHRARDQETDGTKVKKSPERVKYEKERKRQFTKSGEDNTRKIKVQESSYARGTVAQAERCYFLRVKNKAKAAQKATKIERKNNVETTKGRRKTMKISVGRRLCLQRQFHSMHWLRSRRPRARRDYTNTSEQAHLKKERKEKEFVAGISLASSCVVDR